MKERCRQVSFRKFIFFFKAPDAFFFFGCIVHDQNCIKNGWKDFQEMNLIVGPNHLSGEIAVPGSKSHTIRAVAMGMMADGVTRIHAPLLSEDSMAAVRAATLFGASIDRGDDSCWSVTGTGGKLLNPGKTVDMANSGTSIKIFAGLASLLSFPGRCGSVIYLSNYLSVMFQISDAVILKRAVASSLKIQISLADESELECPPHQDRSVLTCVSDESDSIPKSYILFFASKIAEALASQGPLALAWCRKG